MPNSTVQNERWWYHKDTLCIRADTPNGRRIVAQKVAYGPDADLIGSAPLLLATLAECAERAAERGDKLELSRINVAICQAQGTP